MYRLLRRDNIFIGFLLMVHPTHTDTVPDVHRMTLQIFFSSHERTAARPPAQALEALGLAQTQLWTWRAELSTSKLEPKITKTAIYTCMRGCRQASKREHSLHVPAENSDR